MSAYSTRMPKFRQGHFGKFCVKRNPNRYKVLDDSSMTDLVESIKEYGLLNRIIVRPLEDNTEKYEIISGHRRVHAADLLEMKEVPAVVHFIDRDEATVMMVDSNCQRENLTLMEKARSYRMKADALSHQGKTLGQNVPKSEDNRTTAKIGNEAGDSYKTVQRLIDGSYSPFRFRGIFIVTSPSCVFTVFFECPLR